MIQAVTVYCSSSSQLDPVYYEAGAALGREVARAGWRLVYGGNHIGLMQTLADAAREAGGKVTGVTPQTLVDAGIHDTLCDELIVTAGMRERKALMEERGDAFIALPGGLGTFEEVFEIIVGRQLGYHAKPIVLLNIANYYEPLLAMIDHGIEQRFIKAPSRALFHVSETVSETIDYLNRTRVNPAPAPDPSSLQSKIVE